MIINNEVENFVDATEFEKEFGNHDGDNSPMRTRRRRRWGTLSRLLIFNIALFATLIPVGVGEIHTGESSSQVDRYKMLHGYYAMNEQELLDIVKYKGIEVYWTGPVEGAKYVLDASEIDRVTVRYLRKGENVDDIDSGTRIISTYTVRDGFGIIKRAALTEGATGISIPDGKIALYYNKFPKNVYLGIPGKDIQVEIYDQEPGRSLILAGANGVVRPI